MPFTFSNSRRLLLDNLATGSGAPFAEIVKLENVSEVTAVDRSAK